MPAPGMTILTLLAAALLLPAQDAAQPEPATPTGTLLVVHITDGTLGFLDLESGEMQTTMPVGEGPHEIALSPDGALAAIPDYGGSGIAVVDVERRELLRSVTPGRRRDDGTAPYRRLHGIALLSRSRALVTAEAAQHLLLVDLEDGSVLGAFKTAARMSHMVLPFDGGRRALVASKTEGTVGVFDVEGGRLTKTVLTDAGAQGMALRPGAREAWVVNIEADSISVLDLDELEETAELACPDYPVRIGFTPDGSRAVVSHYRPGTVSIWNAESRELLAEVLLPPLTDAEADAHPLPPSRKDFARHTSLPVGLLVHPDGRHAYFSCTRADRVVELDLLEARVTRTLKTGREPDGLALVKR